MATFGRERPGATGAAVAAQAGGTHSQARLLSSAEDRRRIGLEKESCREGRDLCVGGSMLLWDQDTSGPLWASVSPLAGEWTRDSVREGTRVLTGPGALSSALLRPEKILGQEEQGHPPRPPYSLAS